MNTIAEALRQAEIKLAEAREYIQAAHSLTCVESGSSLAEMAVIDLLGAARDLETRLCRVCDAIKEDAKP